MALSVNSIRKRLRELSAIAYERELHQQMARVAGRFDDWRNKKISIGELSRYLEEHGYGQSRELFGMYHNLQPELTVARAVVRKLLTNQEVGRELLHYLDKSIKMFSKTQSGN
jgi:hypothetical protein